MRPAGVALVLTCLLGVPAGIGAFTFVYAKGFSYLSTDPRACVIIATCNGFHAPQELARILGEAIDYARQGHHEATLSIN